MSDAPAEVDFLTVEVVLALHQRQLDRFSGGAACVLGASSSRRSPNRRRRSAVPTRTTACSRWRRRTCSTSSRTIPSSTATNGGLLAAQVFLDVNGVTLEHDSEAFYALTMGVAEGRIDKSAVAAELERIAKSKPAT